MDKLFRWVYCQAANYYDRMTQEHARLTSEDAEDLAAQFVLDFDAVWRDVRSVARYTRVVLKRNLYRHLAAISQRPRAVPLELLDAGNHSVSQDHAPWMKFSDRTYDVYRALCREYHELPISTKILINARLVYPPTPYGVVCRWLGIDEATARVRANRFLKRVRRRCEDAERRRSGLSPNEK